MINRREKLQLFNKLRGGDHAMADISLLDDVQPNHPKLARFCRDPKRYADEILYALLDFCDEEEITDNREFHESTDDDSSNTSTEEEKKTPDASSNTSTGKEDKESSTDSPEEASGTSPDSPSDTPSDTPEGDASPEPDAHDSANQDEDSKKK